MISQGEVTESTYLEEKVTKERGVYMLQQNSNSDHTSLININEGSTLVSIPSTGRPFRGRPLDMFVFNTETHTCWSHPASERFDTAREEVAHA